MKVLAIETSCDDTAIAVAECPRGKDFKLLSNVVSSQIEIHKKFGGVYPALARREHQKNLVPALELAVGRAGIGTKSKKPISNYSSSQVLKKLGRTSKIQNQIKKILERESLLRRELLKFLKKYPKPDIDLIAVTQGPGLDPCLWTGINFAKALASAWKLPIIPINHIEAHILVSFLNNDKLSMISDKTFPAISLIVSGGHTQLILVKNIGHYKIIGETRDDAAGEAFDKIARILGLGYPGGPAIEKEAEKTNNGNLMINDKLSIKLPRPMLYTKNYDFSFSGLKTAVLYDFKKRKKITKKYVATMAKESQQAIIDVLVKKTLKAAKSYKVKGLVLGGGVTANKELRKQLGAKMEKEKLNFNFFAPEIKFCADNAAMVALAACFNKNLKPIHLNKLAAKPNLRL